MDFDAWVAKVDEISGGKPIATKELLEAYDAGLTPEGFAAMTRQPGGRGKRLWLTTVCDVLAVLSVANGLMTSVYQAQSVLGMQKSQGDGGPNMLGYLVTALGSGVQPIAFGVMLFALGRYIGAHPQWFGFDRGSKGQNP
jgi:hypothetical protein